MKKLRTVALMLISVMVLGMLGGCGGSFDASAYVKALLDNSYKNDSTDFVSQKIGTKEEAAALYEEGLDAEMGELLSSAELSPEMETAYREVFAKMLAKADYTVGDAEKKDKNFVVTITYKQLIVFEPAYAEYMTGLEALYDQWSAEDAEMPSEEEMLEQIYGLLKDCLNKALDNAQYGEEQTTTVTVELNDNVYSPNQNDLLNLETSLFDVDAAANLE